LPVVTALAEERSKLQVHGGITSLGDADPEAKPTDQRVGTEEKASRDDGIVLAKVATPAPHFACFDGESAVDRGD
jgi:hypothetical protein